MASADCSSSYSALQATGKKRFQGGGTMLLSCTNAVGSEDRRFCGRLGAPEYAEA